jgi:hypothetical protein
MKQHMRTHSYKFVQFQCEFCEFIGGEEIDMEVHTAKLHGEKIECGLCEYEAKDIGTLEIHLATCEYYECAVCGEKIWQFTDIKEHILANHKILSRYDSNGVKHIKQSRENAELYDKKFHKFFSLFPELENEIKTKT